MSYTAPKCPATLPANGCNKGFVFTPNLAHDQALDIVLLRDRNKLLNDATD